MKKADHTNLRDAQSRQTRQRLLDASLELFVYKGYGGTTIRDITSRAHVSPGLLFHYFDSKEDMLQEHIILMNKGIEGIAGLLSDTTQPPLKAFEQVAHIILTSFEEDTTRKLFLLSAQIGISNAISKEVRSSLLNTLSVDSSIEPIKRGQQMGVIRSGDPHALALTFWGTLHGIVELLVWQPAAKIPDAALVLGTLRP